MVQNYTAFRNATRKTYRRLPFPQPSCKKQSINNAFFTISNNKMKKNAKIFGGLHYNM